MLIVDHGHVMSNEPLALSTIPAAQPAPGDYDAIFAALMRTERGRSFLQEYTKRTRTADTEVLQVAIQRIEAVVRADKSQQAQHGFRSDLLEMAETISRVRAEVAEIRPDPGSRGKSDQTEHATAATATGPRSTDVFAAAGRIRDVTWAMRGHGFDPSVCGQIEELAASILSASSPGPRRPPRPQAGRGAAVSRACASPLCSRAQTTPSGRPKALTATPVARYPARRPPGRSRAGREAKSTRLRQSRRQQP